ncbi:MAG: hypothetical protein GY714_01945 [Desulfobacterales bacterium]|nr:hypothetical protein [Desulfobacterales bacterium]
MATQVQLDAIYVGDTQQVTVSIVDSDGNPVDITGYTLEYTVKTSKENEIELYTVSDTVFTTPTTGVHTFIVPDTETENWLVRSNSYDVVTIDTDSYITTYQIGAFNVLLPVHNTP